MIKNLYDYRELLKSNVKKEIRGKYKGSFLGVLWSFVNPLLSVLVYAIVFPIILKQSQDNYVTFLIIGILPWTFFTTVINQGTFTIVGNAGIIKKVFFPREILPISVVTSGLVNFLISCLIIFIFLIFGGIGFSSYILLLPLIIITQYILSLGIVFITSAINVYVRDAEYIINFFIMMLFYATPILYSSELFEGTKFAWILKLNPMASIINSYRDILFYQQMPDLKTMLIVLIGSIALLFIGIHVFKKLEKGFAEEV
ncbi:MAG: ABC transporter permease [Bacilli bacterium]|nr:ABC transporter permease [Bacilli bacterium]